MKKLYGPSHKALMWFKQSNLDSPCSFCERFSPLWPLLAYLSTKIEKIKNKPSIFASRQILTEEKQKQTTKKNEKFNKIDIKSNK